MLSKLEDILKEKERELKLYQRFQDLVRFCEEEVFPFTPVPLQRHIEKLQVLVENLILEPKDRTEELFSGEIFALLGAIYFHDIGAVTRYTWMANAEILEGIENPPRTLVLNTEIAKRLAFPEKAMELINSLIFGSKKVPLEWELREGDKKAIVRNAKVLGEIFSFAHLMWDIFSADSGYTALRRLQNPDLELRFGNSSLAVDSKEGLIYVKCTAQVPYQMHVIERVKEYVEGIFKRFKESVNGRLGFQYRELVWDVEKRFEAEAPIGERTGIFPIDRLRGAHHDRWIEASQLLDKLFKYGHIMVVGRPNTGKTSLVNSFVVPQLRHLSPNIFYVEIWDEPVREIKNLMEKETGTVQGGSVDVISLCNRLLARGACFFILDGCERLRSISTVQQEKFERFVDFCVERENVYLVALGEKEEFFEWYKPFRNTSLSAVFEVAPIGGKDDKELGSRNGDTISEEGLKKDIDEILHAAADEAELREVVYVLMSDDQKKLKRYNVDSIVFETCIDKKRILEYLRLLKEKDIVREQEVFNSTFFSLTDRYIKEQLREQLGLGSFGEKRKLRETLRQAREHGAFLEIDTLTRIGELKDKMMFTKEEMGLIIASLVRLPMDVQPFLDKAEKETKIFDPEYLLFLLADQDKEVRERTVRVLAGLGDESVINPLLAYLKKTTEPNLKGLLVDSLIATGRRHAIMAVINLLAEADEDDDKGETDIKLKAVDAIALLPPMKARELLIEVAGAEKDPCVIDKIDVHLAKLEQ